MLETKSLKDKIVKKLTRTHGEELDITCNITHSSQIDLFVEEMGYRFLGSEYITQRADMLKRLTCSYQARNRQDLVEIGKAAEYIKPGSGGIEDF